MHAGRLTVPKEPRPPYSKALAIACCALLVPTAAMALIISPLAFNHLYCTDSVAANDLGQKLQLAIFWVRWGMQSLCRMPCIILMCTVPILRYHDHFVVHLLLFFKIITWEMIVTQSRVVVLALWMCMITYLLAFAMRSYCSDRKVRDSSGFSSVAPVKNPVPVRSLAAIQKVDGRLLVRAISCSLSNPHHLSMECIVCLSTD